MNKMQSILISTLVLLLGFSQAFADEIHVAVASNFTDASKDIAKAFEQKTGHKVILAFGSTGKHYAQIKNGAPFAAFFAADVKRPKLLEQEGLALPDSRFTYAIGKVVLWSPEPGLIDANAEVLNQGDFRYLALANPKLAPYGKAAEQVMRAKSLWTALQNRMVRGENIGQTFQFVNSGNAQIGFVAYAQIKRPGTAITGSFWEPAQSLYDPIEQQAVLLKDQAAARDFLDFVKSETAIDIIQGYGYAAP
ncbi:MAG: molybdate ABC transporter substrate-binding protein [Methylococcales bacterium]|nr:molybdate ABC transporter substrate-binding protein [Methylococcales bacterium]